jgi:hypothetical protein
MRQIVARRPKFQLGYVYVGSDIIWIAGSEFPWNSIGVFIQFKEKYYIDIYGSGGGKRR